MRINNHIFLVGSGKMGFDWTNPSDCNVYLIYSEGELALVDTGTGTSIDKIYSHIESFGFSLDQIKKVLLTHVHADHCGGAALIKEKTGAKVYVHEQAGNILATGDEEKIDLLTAKVAGFYPQNYFFAPCEPDVLIGENDSIYVGNLELRVIETPGHSAFDLSFYINNEKENQNYLFSGDTVFFGGKISMISSQDFNVQKLKNSINKLSRLKVNTLLPGHFNFALNNGSSHISIANEIFNQMGIPPNIND